MCPRAAGARVAQRLALGRRATMRQWPAVRDTWPAAGWRSVSVTPRRRPTHNQHVKHVDIASQHQNNKLKRHSP